MGYRSEVRAIVYGSKDQLDALITAQRLIEGSTVFKDFEGSITRHEFSLAGVESKFHGLVLAGDSWKWYPVYDVVIVWEKFMEAAEEMGLLWEFIRVGEESGDVEHRMSAEIPVNLYYTTKPSIGEDFLPDEGIPLNLF
jgi:hypothetical protein